jgi:hypothetical protein
MKNELERMNQGLAMVCALEAYSLMALRRDEFHFLTTDSGGELTTV